MELRHIFLITAILGTAIFVVPAIQSLFAGQHSFYDLEGGFGGKCLKCHADVYDELTGGGHHKNIAGAGSGEECTVCHRVGGTSSKEVHAASTLVCGYCHFNSSNPFGAPVAGGFGKSDFPDDTGIHESHRSFVAGSEGSDLLRDEGESCVACHGDIRVRINFTTGTRAKIECSNSYNVSSSSWDWDITNIYITESTSYTEVK
jgi:hypothetical protein